MKKILQLFYALLLGVELCAQDSSEAPKKFQFNGYIKNLQTLNFDKDFKENISGNLVHNRLNFKWKPDAKFTAVAEFRNRLFWGEEVKTTPRFSKLLRNENEKINLQKAWIDKPSLVVHSNTERLYVDYKEDKINVRIGRQRINWGIASNWNPNDIFNVFNFLDFDYEERPGVDGGKLLYVFNNSFSTEVAYAHTGKKNGSVAALKYGMNKWNYDFQLITGWYNEHPTVGAGWAGYIKDAGFKGEMQYFFGLGDSTDHFNLSLEGDYMLKSGWYINSSVLFNSNGLYRPVEDLSKINLRFSPENLMPTKWNIMLSGSRAFSPLFTGTASVLYAPGTNFLIVLPSAQYNMATNLDISLVWQSFFTELQNRFEAINHRCFLRIKWSF
jgi:hypothetical protein